jgi:hypothetical protein
MNADEIKAAVAAYFRYDKQAALIAFEASDHLSGWSGEPADVLVVTDSRLLYEIEVKITLSDLKHDEVKNKHRHFRTDDKNYPVNRFFFAVPNEIAVNAEEICEKMYPYAGILSVKGGTVNHPKQARILHTKKLSFRQIYELTRQQSGTLCRLSRDLADSRKRAGEYWDQVKALTKEVALQKAINSTSGAIEI